MTDAGFLTEIAAAPDDAAPYLIYSDALQLRGDPRGELIAIQHALETAPPEVAADLRRREAELLAANRETWLGPLADHVDDVTVRWRFGFLHAARVHGEDPAPLSALLAAPGASSTLAALHLGASPEGDDWTDCQALIDALPWHPGFRHLHVCDVDLRGMFAGPDLRIPERAKQLSTLVVQTPALALAWDATPAALRRLELRVPGLDARALLAVQAWPALESLVVWTEDPRAILRMLERAPAPRLRHLGLCGSTATGALVAELVKHPIAKQLASLDLRGGTLTRSRTLQAIADRVQLDVRWNLLGKQERAQLAAFGCAVEPQRRGTASLLDEGELSKVHVRVRGACYEAPRGDRERAYAKTVAATPDPVWLFEGREYLASQLPQRARRDALVALALECEAQLVPRSEPATIAYRIGELSDALVEGFVAEVWLWRSVHEARWIGDEKAEVRALGLIGTTRMRRGDPVHAAAIMDRVLAHYLARGTKHEQAWALRQRGNVDLVRSEFVPAEDYYRRALALYRGLADRGNESIVLSELAGVLWSRQDFEGAVAMIREGIAMKAEGSLGLGSSYYNLGAVLNGMGRLDESREAAARALEIFREHQRRDGEGQALSLLGELAQRSNRHDEAQRLLEQALACHRERGAVRETGITLGNLGRVALDRADYARARALAEEAVELHRECGNKYNEGMQLLDCADAAIGERRLDDARALTAEAIAPLAAISNLPALAAAKCRYGYVAQLRGELAEAERHYDEAIADATRGNYPEQVGWVQLYRAVIRAQQGRATDARALVAEARGHLADSLQGLHTLAVTEAVIARLAGDAAVAMPAPLGFDAHLIASFAR